MQVILLQDVAKLGHKNDLVTVKDGYALNALIPKKLAKVATPGAIKAHEEHQAHASAENKKVHETRVAELSKLEGATTTITSKANEQGHLFAGITADVIAVAVNKEHGTGLSAAMIVLAEPLKEVGEHELVLQVGDTQGKTKILVEAEK